MSLIAILGWSPDDFESAAREASRPELEDARKVAASTHEGEDERSKQLSAHAVRFIDDLLAGGDGKYWERATPPGQAKP